MLAPFLRHASRSVVATSSSLHRRTFLTRTLPLLQNDDLPYHLIMGLPALSPTMETGALAEWYVQEGDKFSAGDAIAKIETDKASIDFEAQDDAYVAKILVAAGDGTDIQCGTPILITVDEEADVAAFKDYQLPVQEEVTAPPSAATQEEEPAKAEAPSAPEVKEASPPPAPATTPAPAEQPASPPQAAKATPPPPATTINGSSTTRLTMNPSSALRQTLGKSQQVYIDKYGTTGQHPV